MVSSTRTKKLEWKGKTDAPNVLKSQICDGQASIQTPARNPSQMFLATTKGQLIGAYG